MVMLVDNGEGKMVYSDEGDGCGETRRGNGILRGRIRDRAIREGKMVLKTRSSAP